MCAQPRRPQYSSFNHFFGQVDELLGEISHQAQRQAQLEAQRRMHCQRQQRKRALRAQFSVSQNESGWQVDGDIRGFNQENLSIEVTNEYTLKVSGNTEWKSEKALTENTTVSAVPEKAPENKSNDSTATQVEATPTTRDSDTESHRSYQATVEDDFEDLGAETSSLISASSESSTVPEVAEPKGKEKAVEEPVASNSNSPAKDQNEESENQEQPHGSFERTFTFPERIDAANVRATFKDGALSIVVPKAPAQEPKSITIL